MKVSKRSIPFCPICLVRPSQLRVRMTTDSNGTPKFSGKFYSCECGALTDSISTGNRNLRNDVADGFIAARDAFDEKNKAVTARAPIVRRKAR